jgi:hypothetical protein
MALVSGDRLGPYKVERLEGPDFSGATRAVSEKESFGWQATSFGR